MRRSIACLLLVLLTLLAACSKSEPATPTAPPPREGLTWTGSEITGLKYFIRRTERATVHYALPTTPNAAEQAAEQVAAFYKRLANWEREPRVQHVHVWIVPPGYAWPQGAKEIDSGVLAVAPGVIIMAHPYLDAQGGTLPIEGALAAAAFEPEGSPIYAQAWLQVGMGYINNQDWNRFPVMFWRMRGDSAKNILAEANGSAPNQWSAWVTLSTLLLDRFGFGWSSYYTGDPADLTPEAALKWAFDTDDVNTALERFQHRSVALGDLTKANISPDRMAPALPALPPGPGPNPNYSPHNYEIDVALDPAQSTVSGELRLTWKNGESLPLDALYFNLWANAERHRMYGGYTEIGAVTVDGKPGTYTAKGIDLKVDLGRSVQPREQVVVAIRFTTHLTASLSEGLGMRDRSRFTLSQFYPILAVLDDRGWNLHALRTEVGDPYSEHAGYQVRLTVPAGFVVGGTGRQLAREESSDSWSYRWEAASVPEWGAAGGRNWVESKAVVGGTTVRVLDADAPWSERVLTGAVETLAYMQQELGPTPLPELVVVRGVGSLPGVISAGDTDSSGWYKNGLANGMAAQWFGTYVGNDRWTEAWLNKGLSKYMERQAARALGRGVQAVGIRLFDRPRDARVTMNGMEFLTWGEIDRMAGDFGALFFEELEKQIGSDAMNRLLRQWLQVYGGRTGTGADLIRMAEAIAGPLGPLLEEHAIDPADRVPYQPIVVPGYGR